MKSKEIFAVTKENFDEYRETVCQMEHRRKKLLAERKWAEITAGAAFFIAALSAAYGLADMIELPLFPHLQFLGPFWKMLCAFFLPEGYSFLVGFLFSVLATILIALAVHIVTALAVGAAYPKTPPAPLTGSDVQQAAALSKRCKAAGTSLPKRTENGGLYRYLFISAVYAVILLVPTLLIPEELDSMMRYELVVSLLSIITLVCIFLLIYAIPYAVLLWLTSFLYRIRREYELESVLNTYVKSCEEKEKRRELLKAEQERIEEERRQTEKAEQDRLQGDELYRQAIADGNADEDLIQRAADLGCRPACLHMGRTLSVAFGSDSYTKAEKKQIAKIAKDYLRIASMEENDKDAQVEAQFLLLSFQTMTESGTLSKWQDMLSQLRHIRDSGRLPENLLPVCAQLIDIVVVQVDSLAGG